MGGGGVVAPLSPMGRTPIGTLYIFLCFYFDRRHTYLKMSAANHHPSSWLPVVLGMVLVRALFITHPVTGMKEESFQLGTCDAGEQTVTI